MQLAITHPSAQGGAADEGTTVLKPHMTQPCEAAQPASMPKDDVEKGYSLNDHADEPVDFLGGFSLNSSFDPQKDV